MFLEFLSLVAGLTVFISAFMEAKDSGKLGTVLGLVIGLTLGCVVFWGVRRALRYAVRRLSLHEPNPPPSHLALSWFICVAVLVGSAVLGVVVSWLTRKVIHTIH